MKWLRWLRLSSAIRDSCFFMRHSALPTLVIPIWALRRCSIYRINFDEIIFNKDDCQTSRSDNFLLISLSLRWCLADELDLKNFSLRLSFYKIYLEQWQGLKWPLQHSINPSAELVFHFWFILFLTHFIWTIEIPYLLQSHAKTLINPTFFQMKVFRYLSITKIPSAILLYVQAGLHQLLTESFTLALSCFT